MKLLRYLLSHGLLLLFIVALVLAYYYRVQLFSDDINTRIDRVVEKSLAWTEIFRQKEPATPPVQTPVEVATITENTTTETAPVVTSEPPAVEATTEPSAAEPVQQAQEEAMPVPESAVTQDVAVAEATPADPQQSTEPVDDQTAAAASHAELLNQARMAFQNGKVEQAVQLYAQLTELNGNDPNIPGELGNVFYSQGKWKEAGAAYYEAATRLLARGEMGQVQYLYRVIQGLDPESAEKLRSQLGG